MNDWHQVEYQYTSYRTWGVLSLIWTGLTVASVILALATNIQAAIPLAIIFGAGMAMFGFMFLITHQLLAGEAIERSGYLIINELGRVPQRLTIQGCLKVKLRDVEKMSSGDVLAVGVSPGMRVNVFFKADGEDEAHSLTEHLSRVAVRGWTRRTDH